MLLRYSIALSLSCTLMGSWPLDPDEKPLYRTPPSAPAFTQPPVTTVGSPLVYVVGEAEPEINIVVLNASDDTPLMSTYSDINGDWSGYLILPSGTYTVYAVAVNQEDEISAPGYSDPFTVVL